jgi:hypothetical protein
MRRYKRNPHNLFYFWIVANAVTAHCFFFSIREATSVAMADVPPASADVSPEAQKLMTACEGAMAITNCVDTGSEAHDSANATFEEAASQLEELGYSHEVISDGVLFSREPVVEEYDPSARIAAAAFLGLGGSVELGSLDQVMDVSAYRGFNRCPVLVCSKSKEKGKKNIYFKPCSNPSKFHSMGQHFCGVHKFALTKHPKALEEGRVFVRVQNGRGRL